MTLWIGNGAVLKSSSQWQLKEVWKLNNSGHDLFIFEEMYVNRVDFRKITYRLMYQYALECTKKVCSICLNHLFQIFPQACRPFSASKLLKYCASLCYGIYYIKTKLRIFRFLKIDEHS